MEAADRKRKQHPASTREDREDKRRGGDVKTEERPATEADVEQEMEEFFAIVRRMRAAAARLPVGGANRRGGAGEGPRVEDRDRDREGRLCRWRPAFELEDFDEAAADRRCGGGVGQAASPASAPIAAVVGERREERAIPARLDLNAEPEPEPVLG